MPQPPDSPSKPRTVGTDGGVFSCPICKTPLPNADGATFPFCSERCRLIDLKHWIDGKYTISRPIDPTIHVEDRP